MLDRTPISFERKFPEMPDYRHYARLDRIDAEEAQWLLANFEADTLASGSDGRVDVVRAKMLLTQTVVWTAIHRDQLRYHVEETHRFENEEGKVGYNFRVIFFEMPDFCTWALTKKYVLPEELKALANNSELRQEEDHKDYCDPEAPNSDGCRKNKGGKPQGSLAEAVEHAYKKLRDQGRYDVLRGRALRFFLKRLREMATEGNENQDHYILERLESVKAPDVGPCSVKTRHRKISFAQHNKEYESATYNANAVSKLLTKLRERFPIPL